MYRAVAVVAEFDERRAKENEHRRLLTRDPVAFKSAEFSR